MLEKRYIHGITGIESLRDALDIRKNPAAVAIGGYAAGKVADQVVDPVIEAAKNKLSSKEEEVDAATQELQDAEKKAQEKAKAQAKDAPKTEQGQGVGITGMKNPESSNPSMDQQGAELQAPDKTGLNRDPTDIQLSIDRNWFVNNFGMTGSEMASLLILKKEVAALDALYPLLIAEKKAILSTFPGVAPNLVKSLPLTDVDYDNLNKYSERLGIPFRRFVKMWQDAETHDLRQKAYDSWREVIDADLRLSTRERSILKQCSEILLSRGALNAQTLKFNGVSASPAEISSLIKSHGFLFDIIAVGEVSKSIGRGLFYDVKRRDVILKDAGRFVAGLIENNAVVKFDSRYNPRIEVAFSAPTAPWYASALNDELSTKGVRAARSGLLIEGESAVKKALDLSVEYISNVPPSIALLKMALDGDSNALVVLCHDSLDKDKQVGFLKAKNIPIDEFDRIKKEVALIGT